MRSDLLRSTSAKMPGKDRQPSSSFTTPPEIGDDGVDDGAGPALAVVHDEDAERHADLRGREPDADLMPHGLRHVLISVLISGVTAGTGAARTEDGIAVSPHGQHRHTRKASVVAYVSLALGSRSRRQIGSISTSTTPAGRRRRSRKGPERPGEQPRELGGPLDHELPAHDLGAPERGRRQVDGEPGYALERMRALGDERARLAFALPAHGDRAEPPEGRIAKLGAQLDLVPVECRPGLRLRGFDGVVLGMERLGDDPAPRPRSPRPPPRRRANARSPPRKSAAPSTLSSATMPTARRPPAEAPQEGRAGRSAPGLARRSARP